MPQFARCERFFKRPMVVLFKIRDKCAGVRATSVEVSGHLPAASKEAAAHLTFTQKQACLQDGEDGAELEKACYRNPSAKAPEIHPGDEAPFLVWRGEGEPTVIVRYLVPKR